MSGFAFIAKLIGITGRVGAVFALVGGAIRYLHQAGIEPFATLDTNIYQFLNIAGVIGFCAFIVEILYFICSLTGAFLIRISEISEDNREKKRLSIKNYDAMTFEYVRVFSFLRHYNMQRFLCAASSDVLFHMRQAFLLESDDPNLGPYSTRTYYVVPKHIWARINNDSRIKDLAVPEEAPWLRPPQPHGWMR